MRRVGLVLVLTFLVVAPSVAAEGGLTPATSGLSLAIKCWGTGSPWLCRFTAIKTNPSIIFYRFDANNDGVYDFPSQAGCPTMGCWTTINLFLMSRILDGLLESCVQGWDGASVQDGKPLAATACSRIILGGTLTIIHWLAILRLPDGYDTSRVVRGSVTLEDLPVREVPGWPPPTKAYEVDLAALRARLGSGPHVVNMRGLWETTRFTTAGNLWL